MYRSKTVEISIVTLDIMATQSGSGSPNGLRNLIDGYSPQSGTSNSSILNQIIDTAADDFQGNIFLQLNRWN